MYAVYYAVIYLSGQNINFVHSGGVLLPQVEYATSLAAQHPEISRLWHPTRNGGLDPGGVMPASHRKIWWQCSRGHEWEAMPFSLLQGTGCPYCAGKKAWPGFNDLATLYPNLAREWHPELNGALTPREVTKGSHKQIWWQCPEGHTWKAMVFARAKPNGTGCPVCAGTTRRKEPKIG